jgi:protein dithiol:quinone oxidoreductase
MFNHPRINYGLAAFACAVILAFAFYLQIVKEMEPCPLCWFQRLAVLGLFFVFLTAAFVTRTPNGGTITLLIVVLIALIGLGVAGRHIWIQNLPADKVPSCGQGISYMLESMPFLDVFEKTLKGSGECAKRDTWLGLTLPSWTTLFFLLSIVWAWMCALGMKPRR